MSPDIPRTVRESEEAVPEEAEQATPRNDEDPVDVEPSDWDEVVEESFPASDPPPGPSHI